MSPLVDPTGIPNVALVAHVQSQAVQKSVSANAFAPELSNAMTKEAALEKVAKDSGVVGHLSSAVALNELKDDEEPKEEENLNFREKEEEEEENNEDFSEDLPRATNPFVGNLLNLKV